MNSIPRIPLGNGLIHLLQVYMSTLKACSEDSLILLEDSLIYSLIFNNNTGHIDDYFTVFPHLVHNEKSIFSYFTPIGLLFILNINYWAQTMQTLALVLTSVIISIIVGIPIGILASQNERFSKFLKPTLDFMQTMPAFVYLIPAITFFGVGVVPGIIASVIFAMPPTIRFTDLGIRQVPEDLIEAANAFGSTASQNYLKYNYHLQLERLWLV